MYEPDHLNSGNASSLAKVEVKPMVESDLPEVMEIEKVSFPTPWSKESYLAELENEAAQYRVVRLEGKLVGYGGMWLIVMKPYHQRCGPSRFPAAGVLVSG